MSKRVESIGENALAAMPFSEIGRQLGITTGCAKKAYERGIARLRKMPGNMENLRQLADELERKRPVQVDWFGADDEEQRA